MAKKWVDFKAVKEQVSIRQVLEHYDVTIKKSGRNSACKCPIHNGSNPRQFSFNDEKNAWNCFGNCKTGGNVLDLVSMIEFGDKAHIRDAALLLQEWFALSSDPPKTGGKKLADKRVRKKKSKPKVKPTEAPEGEELINQPLSFTLKNLVPEHPWFDERGISKSTIDFFGLGLQEKGKFIPGRIAIPIHNEKNELVKKNS